MKMPETVIDYLSNAKISTQSYLMLAFDENFVLEDFFFQESKRLADYGLKSLSKGVPLEDIYPFLEPVLDEITETGYLPGISLKNDIYYDFHIIVTPDHHFWVAVIDKTPENIELQKRIQQMNEEALSPERIKTDIGLNVLYHLDVAVFRYTGAKHYQLLTQKPTWLRLCLKTKTPDLENLDLAASFAYIESFEEDAIKFWGEEVEGRLDSCQWTETDINGKDHYLQARALYCKEGPLLLIGPTCSYDSEKQRLIQKAREKSLDFEKKVKQEKVLKRMVALKDQFVSVVSHDLRAPAANVLSYFNFLFEDKEFVAVNSKENIELITTIYQEIENLINYNEKVYHWINLELGRTKIKLVELDAFMLIYLAVSVFKNKARRKKIEIKSDLTEGLMIKVDESLFRNVIFNLLGNAIKFTPNGGQIEIRLFQKNDHIYIQIADNGIGIDSKAQTEIFNEYNITHSEGTEGESGSGLGLGICKKIIDVHGFEISFQSEAGKGTEFTIKI